MRQIERLAAAIPDWQGLPVIATRVSGGLTNENYRVEVAGRAYFVRFPGRHSRLLGIDVQRSYSNTEVAAASGIGAPVAYRLRSPSALVLHYIQGTTLGSTSLGAPGMLDRVVQCLQALHRGPRFANSFSIFNTLEHYLAASRRRSIALPQEFGILLPIVARVRTVLEGGHMRTVPCHNDLLPENIIDDGSRLWLVDYDYSGTNDPCCDLGYLCNEGHLASEQVVAVCASYFGTTDPSLLARVWLFRFMTNVVSTVWGLLQQSVSEIDHDYRELALDRLQRAVALAGDPRFAAWLDEA